MLIKKQNYWPKEVPEEEMMMHMHRKKVGDVDALPNYIIGNIYHIMAIK